MTGEMAGERDVLAEALHDEFWDSTMVHSASGFRACLDMENGSAGRVRARLAARGYTLRHEHNGDCWEPLGCPDPSAPLSRSERGRPGREDEAYAAGRLAGFEEGLAAAPSPEPLPLDPDPTIGMRIVRCPHCGEELSVWPAAPSPEPPT